MPEILTLADYRDGYRAGMTPRDAVAAVYRRIAAHDDPAIFITLRPEADVIADADALAARGDVELPLYGIPVAVKDNIDVAGVPTTAGCPGFAFTPAQDAVAVARLRAAGALIIGKTNLDQFATGLVGVRSPYGVPRNTLSPDLVPGGSSSGSAVAVAAGLVPLALGTDTAGSGRVPAGLNNIVGLKPTLGAISTTGVLPACRTLDCVSVFALTVDDAWRAYRVLAAPDDSDAYSRDIPTEPRGAVPPGLRIGIPDAAGLIFGGDAAAGQAFMDGVTRLAAQGFAAPRRIDMTALFETAKLLYHGPWVAERYQAIRDFIERDAAALHPVTRQITLLARYFNAADAFAAQYRLAALRKPAAKLWADIDVLMVPTFPRPRTLAELAADPVGPNSELGTYTNFVNLLDMCALAVPAAIGSDRRAAGVTLIAPAGHDAKLADLGALLHAATGLTLGATGRALPPSAPVPANAVAGDIELAVVGAHLSGMALNGELQRLGARFLRKVATARDYRLYALPGGPPYRPGLLRVGAGDGSAIETEVWALTPDAFGRFVAGIPAPLGIGTLTLADGTTPKGFVVESEAVRDAQDISHYGGWRTYMLETAR